MGRTIPSFRMALEREVASWRYFKKRLNSYSQRDLESLFNIARNNCSAASCSIRPIVSEAMFMAMIFGHEKLLSYTASKVEQIRLMISEERRKQATEG